MEFSADAVLTSIASSCMAVEVHVQHEADADVDADVGADADADAVDGEAGKLPAWLIGPP